MQRKRHRRRRPLVKLALLEERRLLVETSKQLLRENNKVASENIRLRKQLDKLARKSN
jgi:hypothetical protein